MIARYHGDGDIAPFFHHELFHLYHYRSFGDCEAVWCTLWVEGLATYVASRLNPGATDAELLLTIPVDLRAAVEKSRTEAICTTLAKLDSSERSDQAALFQGQGNARSALPPRYGYYVGLLAAEQAGRSRTLKQLAALSQDQVRPLLEGSLRDLARCG